MKTVECVTRVLNTNKDRWIYPWKEFTATASYFSSDYSHCIAKHRIPVFLSLHSHLSIEHVIEALWNILFAQFPFKRLLFVYDVLHGIICSYNMREILEWWNSRTDDGTFSEIPY